jgi:hypothetical protein
MIRRITLRNYRSHADTIIEPAPENERKRADYQRDLDDIERQLAEVERQHAEAARKESQP